MSSMGAVGMGMSLAGTAMQAGSDLNAAQAARGMGAAQMQAAQYSYQNAMTRAGQVEAGGSQRASAIAANAPYALGTLAANAAAGGSTATSPTAVAIGGAIRARQEYDALSTVYDSQVTGAGIQNLAALDLYQGQQRQQAADFQASALTNRAATSALSGIGNIAAKYGFYGPNQQPATS